jgi:ABC-type sugar transport system substrate-binding protein
MSGAHPMDRRLFLLTSLAGALATPLAAEAQQAGKVYRIGWLSGSPYIGSPLWTAFIGGMQERGWVEGRNFTVEPLYSEGRVERFADLVGELVRRKVDLIITEGTAPAAAARKARRVPRSYSSTSAIPSARVLWRV